MAQFAEKVRNQIRVGINRRDDEFLRIFFVKKTNEYGTSSLTSQQFTSALEELGVRMTEVEINVLFRKMDVNNDGIMDLDEFKRAVQFPSTIEQLISTLPIAQIFADAATGALPEVTGNDCLRLFCKITPEQIEDICKVAMPFLKIILQDSVKKIEASFTAMGISQDNPSTGVKFEVPREMSSGTIGDFHGGLTGRIGTPVICNIPKVVEAEHCTSVDSRVEFHTPNYGITTTPLDEWEITTKQDTNKADMRHNRRLPNIKELWQIDESKKAGLTLIEILVIVLYTGPMFMLYNAVLRRFPEAESKRGNLYTTTIHVLVSAVLKLMRKIKFPEGMHLYRGTGGRMVLPVRFDQADEHGCRGFTEWGFVSTTKSKKVALMYSGVREGRAVPTVIRIKVEAVDRGAMICLFSQYPGEEEILFIPLCFFAPEGPVQLEVTEDGIVSLVPVRTNVNLGARTMEEHVEWKKANHLACFDFLLGDLVIALRQRAADGRAEERLLRDIFREHEGVTHTVEGLVQQSVGLVREVRAVHEATPAETYTDDARYKGLVTQMLDAGAMAPSVLGLYLEDPSRNVDDMMQMPLQDAHRALVAFRTRVMQALEFGERRVAAAVQLCQQKGLVVERIDEADGSTGPMGETPLVRAAADGTVGPAAIRLLIEAGADVADGKALGVAAEYGQLEAVEILLRARARVDSVAVEVMPYGGFAFKMRTR